MASALEHYVNNVRTLSAAGSYRELAEYLTTSAEILAKNCIILDNVLETLDNQHHSLGVLYVLIAKFTNITGSTEDAENITRLIGDFVCGCHVDQIRLSAIVFAELCHLFTNYLIKNKQNCINGVRIIAVAIEKARQFDTQLTMIHADLCLLSLQAKTFKKAIQILDTDITGITHSEDANQDAKYFLLYYYYGGMIYTAMKNYERALYFFEVAVSTPALAMSHVMLESYKKYILVSLILHGKIAPIPKYSSQVISRFMKPLSHAYHELAAAYGSTLSEDVRTAVNKYRDIFTRDTNLGLVKQVVASLYKKNIQRLTKTFLTLSLADVASRVQLSGPIEAEKIILNMIKTGEIFASINQKDGMVVFKDDPQKYNTPEMFMKVQYDIIHVMELHKQIAKKEETIMLNPLYVKKSIGNQEEEIISCQPKSYTDHAD